MLIIEVRRLILSARKFPLGQVVATAAVLSQVSDTEITQALIRHLSGDWGNLSDQDKQTNENALKQNLRLLSSYKSSNEVKFWIITEADRSITTILLPEDY